MNYSKIALVALLGLCTFTASGCAKSNKTQDKAKAPKVNNFVLTKTGQVNLYDVEGKVISNVNVGDSLYGQDANYQKGETMSYTDNGDNTVTDNVTGLMWQQIPETDKQTWQEAVDYCNNLELGGYTDWRMPTVKELYSIENFSIGWPYIDTTYFGLIDNVHISKDEQYWSSVKYVGVTAEGQGNAAFGVNYGTGHIKAYSANDAFLGKMDGTNRPPKDDKNMPPRDNQNPPSGANNNRPSTTGNNPPPRGGQGGNHLAKHVRAVRGEIYGVNNFVDNKDSTITDQSTGLMWAKQDNGQSMTWVEALEYAEQATLAGYSDWRLPNVKELQSIVDYSYSTSSPKVELQKAAIDPMFFCTAIVNEAGNKDYGYYWTSTSAHFRPGMPYSFAWYVAFGQAVNKEGVDFHGAGAARFDAKARGESSSKDSERSYNFVRLVRDNK